jgi:hypothetical protein
MRPSLTLLSSVRACLMPCAGYDTTVSADSFRIVLPQQHTKRYRVSSHVFPCCSNVGDVNRTCDPASRVRCCSVVNALTVQTWSVHVHTSPSPLRTYASSRMQIYTSDGCPAMPHKYTHTAPERCTRTGSDAQRCWKQATATGTSPWPGTNDNQHGVSLAAA